MNVIGVIAEYNPFHLGHLYQINKVKEMYPDSIIIAIISTNFTQRGDISILNKWDKCKICLECGIDLVIELPTPYAIQSADIFAYGAINILHNLNVDTLIFGTESDNVDELIKVAKLQLNNPLYDKLLKTYLNNGDNNPTAINRTIKKLINIKIDKPNDILALAYIKEIIRNNYSIKPISIKRTNEYHGKIINSNIINANLIREMIRSHKDISMYVPKLTCNYIISDISIDRAFNYLVYNITNNRDNLDEYLTVDEGIQNRLLACIYKANSWDQLVMMIKTKRYTYNKISRMLLQILLDVKKTDNLDEFYVRILGFNQYGRSYLNKIKKEINIPIYTSYKSNLSKIFDIEFKSTIIYGLICNDLSLLDKEYKSKPIIINK